MQTVKSALLTICGEPLKISKNYLNILKLICIPLRFNSSLLGTLLREDNTQFN